MCSLLQGINTTFQVTCKLTLTKLVQHQCEANIAIYLFTVGNFDSYFHSPKVPHSQRCYIWHTYTHEVGRDISHDIRKEAMDTSFLEVAGSSKAAHTLAMCDHLDFVRTL